MRLLWRETKMIEWNTIPKYVEVIEECIREDVRINGRRQLASPGRERVGDRADNLAGILVSLSNTLALELGMGGEPVPEAKALVQFIEQYGQLEAEGYTVTLGGRDKSLLNLKKNKEARA